MRLCPSVHLPLPWHLPHILPPRSPRPSAGRAGLSCVSGQCLGPSGQKWRTRAGVVSCVLLCKQAPSAIWRRFNHTARRQNPPSGRFWWRPATGSSARTELKNRKGRPRANFDRPVFFVSIRAYQNIWHFDPTHHIIDTLISSFCGAWVSASCGSPPRHHSCRYQLHRTPRRIKRVSPLTKRRCRFTGASSTHQASGTEI